MCQPSASGRAVSDAEGPGADAERAAAVDPSEDSRRGDFSGGEGDWEAVISAGYVGPTMLQDKVSCTRAISPARASAGSAGAFGQAPGLAAPR